MLRLALTLHELGTNAAKYGALSVPGGIVHIAWRLEGQRLVLTWRETGGPAVTAPSRMGFGMTLIGAAGGGDAAAVSADWNPDGVVWTIRLTDGVTRLAPGPPPRHWSANPSSAHRRWRARASCWSRTIRWSHWTCAMSWRMPGPPSPASPAASPRRWRRPEQAHRLALLDGNLEGRPVDEVAALFRQPSVPFCFVGLWPREPAAGVRPRAADRKAVPPRHAAHDPDRASGARGARRRGIRTPSCPMRPDRRRSRAHRPGQGLRSDRLGGARTAVPGRIAVRLRRLAPGGRFRQDRALTFGKHAGCG